MANIWQSIFYLLLLAILLFTPRKNGTLIKGTFYRRLPQAPRNEFRSVFRVVGVMLTLAMKHARWSGSIGVPRSRNNEKGMGQEDGGTEGVELPHIVAVAPFEVTEQDVEVFKRIVQPQSLSVASHSSKSDVHHDHKSITPLPLILPSLAFPLIPTLLSTPHSRIKPLGSVNVRNLFRFYPLSRRLGLDYNDGKKEGIPILTRSNSLDKGHLAPMRVTASMGGKKPEMMGRKVKRGVEFDTVVRVCHVPTGVPVQDDSRVESEWEKYTQDEGNGVVFEMVFTTLSLGPSTTRSVTNDKRKPNTAESQQPPSDTSDITWHADPTPLYIPEHLPNRFATLSRDYNPIHLSSILARLFGFKSKIAHGNLVLSLVAQRAFSAVSAAEREDKQSPVGGVGANVNTADAGTAVTGSDRETKATDILHDALEAMRFFVDLFSLDQYNDTAEPSWLEVRFLRPVFVPCAPMIRWALQTECGSGAAGEKTKQVVCVQVYEVVKGVDKVLLDIKAGYGEGGGR